VITGIDVSSYQSETYSLTGVDFVFVKATEGTAYTNPRHAAQVRRARAGGRVVGHYHYLTAGASMSAQMDHFLAKAAPRAGELLAVDWEETGVSGAQKDSAVKYLKSRAGGRKVLLYCSQSFWLTRDSTGYAGDGLWIAQYNGRPGRPDIEAPWVIHQHTDAPLDTDVANFTSRTAMATWAGKAPTPAKPVTPTVDLSQLVSAARRDPGARQGHQTYASGVRRVEAALKAEGLLAKAYSGDGSYGTTTVKAYAAWQRRCGYSGSAADGIPGKDSLRRLGAKRGFTVKD
jgi:hypothetical protein